MEYNYNFFEDLSNKLSLGDLIEALEELSDTCSLFSWIRTDTDEVEKWLVKNGFAKKERQGLCKTNKYEEDFDSISNAYYNYIEQKDKEFKSKYLKANNTKLKVVKNGVLDIKSLIRNKVNPNELLAVLYDLQGTTSVSGMIDIESNIEEFLYGHDLIQKNTKGMVFSLDNEKLENYYNELAKLLVNNKLKLYKIMFNHYSKKDFKSGIEKYLISKTDEKVLDYIIKDFGLRTHIAWSDYEENEINELLKNKGDLLKGKHNYYGETRIGWEEISELEYSEAITLIKLKIAEFT